MIDRSISRGRSKINKVLSLPIGQDNLQTQWRAHALRVPAGGLGGAYAHDALLFAYACVGIMLLAPSGRLVMRYDPP